MQPIVNIRGTLAALPVSDTVQFHRKQTTPRYVRNQCSDIANEKGWKYSVSAPKKSDYITVTRVQ